jgi:CCR4-NOT complex subunit CAF16
MSLVSVKDLTFIPQGAPEPALDNVSLSLPKGSRTLLIGANGGQSFSLSQQISLQLQNSREIHPLADPGRKEAYQGRGRKDQGSRRILPISRRRDLPGYRMVSWLKAIKPIGFLISHVSRAMNPVVRSDILVSHFLDSVGGYRHKERRDLLLDLLDIDLDWHMHNISDGERRRVQLCMGLMAPWDVLLLDEVTVDLDVLVRHQLLEFLKNDSEARDATIICNLLPFFPAFSSGTLSGILQMPLTYSTV